MVIIVYAIRSEKGVKGKKKRRRKKDAMQKMTGRTLAPEHPVCLYVC